MLLLKLGNKQTLTQLVAAVEAKELDQLKQVSLHQDLEISTLFAVIPFHFIRFPCSA